MVIRRLATALQGHTYFRPWDYVQLLKDWRADLLQQRIREAEEAFDEAMGKFAKFESPHLIHGQKTGR